VGENGRGLPASFEIQINIRAIRKQLEQFELEKCGSCDNQNRSVWEEEFGNNLTLNLVSPFTYPAFEFFLT
jgi:hypothetical protein